MSRPDRHWARPRVLIATVFLALAVGTLAAWLLARASDDDPPGQWQTAAHLSSRSRPPKPPAAGERPAATAPAPRHHRVVARPAPRQRHETRSRRRYTLLPRIEPARLVPDPDPIAPADVLQPIANGWRVGDHRGLILVEAGLAGDDPSGTRGRFIVFRERERPFAQNMDVVDVPGAGVLRITRGSSGSRAGHRVLARGKIEFAGETGVTGTLNLRDDTIILDSG